MATFDRTAADSLLKKRYEGPIRDQINTASDFIKQIDRDTESFDGLEVVIPLWVKRNQGIGARTVSGTATAPTARGAGYTQSRFGVKLNAGRIELSVAAMKTMKSNAGSFIRTLDGETKTVTATFKEDRARQVISNGASGQGVLAACTTTSASTTINLTGTTVADVEKLQVGMYIDIIDNDDDSVLASEREITSVTLSSGVPTAIVISGAVVTTDSTHRICRTGNWKLELRGLEGIVDDADDDLQNVDTGNFPLWKANVLGNSGTERPLGEDLLRQLLDQIAIKGDGENVKFLMHYTQRRKLEALLKSQRRVVNTLDLKGGVKAITFDERIPVIVDKFANPTKIFALNTDHLKFYSAADFEWMNEDGAILNRVPNQLAYEATFFCLEDMATDRRNAHGLLEDLAD